MCWHLFITRFQKSPGMYLSCHRRVDFFAAIPKTSRRGQIDPGLQTPLGIDLVANGCIFNFSLAVVQYFLIFSPTLVHNYPTGNNPTGRREIFEVEKQNPSVITGCYIPPPLASLIVARRAPLFNIPLSNLLSCLQSCLK